MREPTIHHVLPKKGKPRPRVRVTSRAQPGAQPQERQVKTFGFAITDEQRQLIQWYPEQDLIRPWGEFPTRAEWAEPEIKRLGVQPCDAVFGSKETAALHPHGADHLAETRVVIHADNPDGIALPWEFLRDSTRGAYGEVARLAHAFVRSQPGLIFEPPTVADGATFNILMVICRP